MPINRMWYGYFMHSRPTAIPLTGGRAWSGSGHLIDPEKFFIVCVNMPGSCYGSIGPLSDNPVTGTALLSQLSFFYTPGYDPGLPAIERISWEYDKIKIGIGGSMGGQQLLEWAIEEPDLFEHIVPIATNAFHSPWARAFNASQRHCIELDPDLETK